MKIKLITSIITAVLLAVGCSAQDEADNKAVEQGNVKEEAVATNQTNTEKDTKTDDAKENNQTVTEDTQTNSTKSQSEQSKETAEVKAEEYTADSYNTYKKAVEAAKKVQADKTATKEEIADSKEAVTKAKSALKKKIDEKTVTINATALAANDLALSLGAYEYTVEGTIPSAQRDQVKKITVTFMKGDKKKEKAVDVKDDGTYRYVISAENFEEWTKVKVSYDYKGKKQESDVKTLTPKVKEQ